MVMGCRDAGGDVVHVMESIQKQTKRAKRENHHDNRLDTVSRDY